MKHNYYIGILTRDGEMKIAYKIEDKFMYWESFKELIENNHKPLKFSSRHSVDSFILGLTVNGTIAFVIDSRYDFMKDLIFRKTGDEKNDK